MTPHTPHAARQLFVPSEAGYARCLGEIQQAPMPEREPKPREPLTETAPEPSERSAAHGFVAGAFRFLGFF